MKPSSPIATQGSATRRGTAARVLEAVVTGWGRLSTERRRCKGAGLAQASSSEGLRRERDGGDRGPCQLVEAQTAPMMPTTAGSGRQRRESRLGANEAGAAMIVRAAQVRGGRRRAGGWCGFQPGAGGGAPIETKKPTKQKMMRRPKQQTPLVDSGAKRRRLLRFSMDLAAVRTMMLVWFLRSLGSWRFSAALSRMALSWSPL